MVECQSILCGEAVWAVLVLYYIRGKVVLEDNGANAVDQIIGHYHVPTPGTHFLEIIGVLCNDIAFETYYKDIICHFSNLATYHS